MGRISEVYLDYDLARPSFQSCRLNMSQVSRLFRRFETENF